jgi:large subunit ribosomal protein L25
VELSCPANAIPDFITIDVAGGDIGDSFHISSVALAEGVVPVIADRDFTIATITGSSAMKSEESEAEVTEGEESAE